MYRNAQKVSMLQHTTSQPMVLPLFGIRCAVRTIRNKVVPSITHRALRMCFCPTPERNSSAYR